MRFTRFVRAVRVEAPRDDVFSWHARTGILERLAPPWEHVTVLERSGGLDAGARTSVRVGRTRIDAVHTACDPPAMFRDEMTRGPFRRWVHTHHFDGAGPGATLLTDEVEYVLPGGVLGRVLGGRYVTRRLRRLFAYRHRVTRSDLAFHAGRPRRRVLVSGANGLLGRALVPFLRSGGHAVTRLVRVRDDDGLLWNPATGWIDADELPPFDAVVHLAGLEPARSDVARLARDQATRRLCETLAAAPRPPAVLVCATGLAEPDRADETAPARGLRVVRLRFGHVLTPAGGVLKRMRWPAGGRGPFPWISIDDAVGVVHHALFEPRLEGPVDAVAPAPTTGIGFARALAWVRRRPALPWPWARDGARGDPARLLETAYPFRHPEPGAALRHLLGTEL